MATARKPALTTAATIRVPNSTAKSWVTAPATCTATNAARSPASALRRGHRALQAAISGAPTTIPTAYADVRLAAAATGTDRSRAMPGTSPDSMNSEVPWAKTARRRTWMNTGKESTPA
ncbi:hypothetical protein SVIOM74S_05839 [Streptomyces violarus]